MKKSPLEPIKLKKSHKSLLRFSFFFSILTGFWLLGWPTRPGPYDYSVGYFLGLLVLGTSSILTLILVSKKYPTPIWKISPVFFKFYLVAVSILMALLVGEQFVRAKKWAECAGGQGPCQPHYRLRNYRINFEGFRGPDIHPADLKGKKVILGVGDSITFGQGVAWEETLFQQLERLLNNGKKYDGPYKVVAVGRPGWKTLDEARYFLSRGHQHKPDILVLQYTLNDAEMEPHYIRPLLPGSLAPYFWRSHLYFYLVKLINFHKYSYQGFISSLYEEGYPGWDLSKKSMEALAAACHKDQISMILIIYPMLQTLDNYPFRDIHEKVAQEGRRLGFKVVDLLNPYLDFPSDRKNLRVSDGDWHPSAEGHRIGAEELAKIIRPLP